MIRLLENAQGKRLENLRNRIRWRLRRHPDEQLRMALAEHYRLRGVGSQAARWGIVTLGWSTPAEIIELRRWLLGRFWGDDEVRDLLSLPSDRPLPREVADLAPPEFRSTGRPPVSGSGGCVSFAAMIVCGLLAIGCVVSSVIWLPGLWQPFASEADHGRAVGSLVTLGAAVLGFAGSALWFRLAARAPDRSGPELSRLFPTELAWRLIDTGDERGAVILLKGVLTKGNEPRQARRALAQLSRDRGRTDQAGRWGVAIEGLTSAAEQAAFAPLVRSKGATDAALRRLSLTGLDEPLTADARHVLELARTPRPAVSRWRRSDSGR